ISLAVSALSLILAGLLIRAGMYPMMSWIIPVARSYRDAAWLIGFGLGPAMILFLKWSTLLAVFGETRLLMLGTGVLSAILVGAIAWGGARGPGRFVLIASCQCSLVW